MCQQGGFSQTSYSGTQVDRISFWTDASTTITESKKR